MSNYNDSRHLVRVMMFVWLGHFIVDFMLGIWPVYKTMIDLDLATAGLLMAGAAIIGEGCQPYMGALADRGYGRGVIITGVVLSCAASFFAYTSQVGMLALLFLSIYLGSGVFHPAASGLVGGLSGSRRNLMMTIFASGGALGMAISQFTFSKVYAEFDGHTLCFFLPAIILIIWASLRSFQAPKTAIDKSKLKPGGYRGLLKFFRHRELRNLYIMLVCNQGMMWAMIFLLPDVLKSRGYDSWLCYGAGHFAFVVGGAMTLIPGGYLADRFSERRVLFWGSIAACAFYYLFLTYETMPAAGVLMVLFLCGACLYVMAPVAIANGIKQMPSEPGSVSAFLMGMVWMVSESCGPGLGGLLTKCFTENAASKALSIIGVCFAVTIWCSSRIVVAAEHRKASVGAGTVTNQQQPSPATNRSVTEG